jgi:hypothetical protein
MVILKATSFLEGHKRDMGMTCSITQGPTPYFVKRNATYHPLVLLLSSQN